MLLGSLSKPLTYSSSHSVRNSKITLWLGQWLGTATVATMETIKYGGLGPVGTPKGWEGELIRFPKLTVKRSWPDVANHLVRTRAEH